MPTSVMTANQLRHRTRKLLGCASMAVLAFAVAEASQAGTINIVPTAGGPSKVTLSSPSSGPHAAVITTSISPNGATALNKFDTFNVGVGTSANLIVPSGANNLVNLVRDQVVIGGTVSSTLVDTGKIGGNLIFVTPNGLILNAGGVINTGRLVIRGNSSGNIGLMADDNTLANALSGGAAGTVELDGTIDAPGGIDIDGSTVNLASTAVLNTGAAGLQALPNADTAWLVSTTGVPVGTAIVKREGGIQIVSASDLTVAGPDAEGTGAMLDARPKSYDGVAAATPAGIELDSSGTLTVDGALTAWSGAAADASGDVTLSATQTVTVSSDFLSQFVAAFESGQTSQTAVQIGGSVTGGEVNVTSSTSVNTSNGSVGAGVLANLAGSAANSLISAATKAAVGADLSLAAYVSLADAKSNVTVAKGATLNAKGDLTIASDAAAVANGNQNTSISGKGLGLVVGYSQLVSNADLTVDGSLTAGKALNLSAVNTSDSEIVAKVTADTGGVGMAVSYNNIGVHSSLGVGGDAVLKGQSVDLQSTTTNDPLSMGGGYITKAYTIATDTGAGGGVAAVTTENITAGLTVAGSVTSTGGDVKIAALNDTILNSTSASASTGNGAVASAKALLSGATESSVLADLIGDALSGVSSKLKSDGTTPAPTLPSTRAAAAVSVALNTESATTSVTGSIMSFGAATISGMTKDRIVRNNSSASASSKQSVNGSTTTIAGAVSWSNFDYTSTAMVGGSVSATALTVNANTDRPLGSYYDLSLPESDGTDDLMSWFKDVVAPKISKSLGVQAGFFGSSAGASVANDSTAKPAIGASVAYMQVGATTTAWIDQGAKLILGTTLNVTAETDFTNLSLGGPLVPTSLGDGVSSKGSSIGGAVAYQDLDPTTIAGIDSGVVVTRAAGVTAIATDVAATTNVEMITIAPLAGSGGDVSLSGTFAVNTIEGETHATISKDANLDLGAGALTLAANLDLNVWAVGGSGDVTKADGTGGSETAASVGVAGALNLIEHDTRALIGDASSDDPTSNTMPVIAPVGGITSGAVTATALATGGVNALSVAGVATNATPAPPSPPDGEAPQLNTEPGMLSKAATSFLSDASNKFTSKLKDELAAYNKKKQSEQQSRQIAGEMANADALANGTPVANSFGLAGSASVNLSKLSTTVDLTNATLKRATAAAAADVTIKAAEGVDMLAVTGGAALATGAKLSGSSTQIAGAFGLSDTTNTTTASVTDSSIHGFRNVSVEGASNGSRIGAGLALSADTTQTSNGAVVAASVSMLIANDGAIATVTGGDITGPSGGTGAVNILAYDGLLMGAGAGGLSFGSSNSAGAAATVVLVNSPQAADAELNGTAVSNYGNLSVEGLDGARIAGVSDAAAATSGTGGGSAAAASLSYNSVTLGATGAVNVGTTGSGNIAISGALDIQAGDVSPSTTEVATADGRSTGTLGSSFFSDYSFNKTGLDSRTAIDASDLTVGTQILSLAIPFAAAGGTGSGGGVAVSYNNVDDNRAASLTGGGTSSVAVGSLSVQAADYATILSLATGAGASSGGTALVGSLSYNVISGTSSATVGGAVASSPLSLTIGKAGSNPGATVNLAVGVIGNGHIYSLSGALGLSSSSAGALAVSYNEIARTSAASETPDAQDAGLHADLDYVTLSGDPNAQVTASSTGGIVSIAIAGAFSNAADPAAAGASSVNTLSPVVVAEATNLNYPTATLGGLTIQAADSSTIQSLAGVLAASKGTAGAPGIAINTIGSEVDAGLNETGTLASKLNVQVGDLLVQATESASTTAFGVGVSGSTGGTALAGSLGLNTTDATAVATVSLDYAGIVATGSMGVLASRDSSIDVAAGVVAASGDGFAGGASVVVDDVGGGATATVTGLDVATVAVTGGGAGIAEVRTGALNSNLPQLDGLDPGSFDNEFEGQQLSGAINLATGNVNGLEIDASSTHMSRTVALTGVAGDGAGIAATAVVENISGNTQASLSGATVTVGKSNGTGAASTLAADVRASTQADSITLAGAVAGGDIAAAAPIVSDGFGATTSATISGGSVTSTGGVTVQATTNQSSTALAVSAGLSASGSLALSVVTPRFESNTTATISDVSSLTASGTGGVSIGANSDATAFAIFASLADSGGSSIAADVVVATNADKTTATYTGVVDPITGLGSTAVSAPAFSVSATGDYSAHVVGVSLAAGGEGVGATANGVGIVDQGTIAAAATDLAYNNTAGAVSVTATGVSQFQAEVGSLAIGDVGASLGAIVVLSQNKIDATLTDPSITAKDITVDGYGATGVDIFDLGVALGGYGGIAANVVYIGVGQVEDTGALFASNGSGNSDNAVAGSAGSSSSGGSNANFTSLASAGETPTAAAGPAASAIDTTAATSDPANSRAAFGAVQSPAPKASADDAAASRVRAQILSTIAPASSTSAPSVLASDKLTVESNANLASKSANYGGAGALGGAGAATIAITRNAANSIARIGSGVDASGGALSLMAVTGQDTSQLASSFQSPTHAAEADVVQAAIGGGAIGIVYADVKLSTASVAEDDGALSFRTATIDAEDNTDAVTSVVGVALGGVALNVAVAQADKTSTVGALLAGSDSQAAATVIDPTTKAEETALTIEANGSGMTSATSIAASGGLLFAGNAAVALATDSRTVTAQIADGATVESAELDLKATVTPQVSASTLGIAVSGQVAAGASVATATGAQTVKAQVGLGATLDCGLFCTGVDSPAAFTIEADILPPSGGYSVDANASGSAGGVLAGLSATVVLVNNTAKVDADVGVNILAGTNTTATTLGPISLDVAAKSDVSQHGESNGAAASVGLAIGAQTASANSSATVEATLGNVADSATRELAFSMGLYKPSLTVSAQSDEANSAKASGGAGALGAAVASLASTSTTDVVTTTVSPLAANTLTAGAVSITAASNSDYNSQSDATEASVAGGSGSTSSNTSNASATINIGDQASATTAAGGNSDIEATSFTIKATNALGTPSSQDGGSASGAGGGVVNGAAALVSDTVTQTAQVNIGAGTTLRQYGDYTVNQLDTLIDAEIDTFRSQTTSLRIGGLVESPFGQSNSTYTANIGVSVGQNALLRGDDGIGIGTVTNQNVKDDAASQVYGLAGIGGASTDTQTTVNDTVSVADGATIEAMGDVHVGAGISADEGTTNSVSATAQTDVFNWTALPISVDHGATATVTITNALNLGDAVIRSARDVTITAVGGGATVSAVGTGHNPYLALFGKSDSGGNGSSSSTGTLSLDGTRITAGFLAQRTIALADDGSGGWTATTMDYDGHATTTGSTKGNATIKSGGSPAGANSDALGQYTISTVSADATSLVSTQIDGLKILISKANLAVPADPNADSAKQTLDQAALNSAAASSPLIAQLALDYSARAAATTTSGLVAANALIATQSDSIIKAGLVVPSDPNIDAAQWQTDQTALDTAAASSPLIAQLSQAYGTRAALVASTPATTLGIEVNGVFAAGGLVNLNVDAVTKGGQDRQGVVAANSSPKITITDDSAYDLVLGNLFIPFKPSGAINYGGAAGATQLAAAATPSVAGASDTPDGLIKFTAGQPYAAQRTDVLEDPAADIQDVGGAFSGLVNNGDFVQFGQIQVGSYNVSVPNGLFTVSNPSGTFGMGVPISLYYGNLGYSEYANQTGTGPTLAPSDAALLVASYIAETAFGVGDTAAATDPNSPNYLPTLANKIFSGIPAPIAPGQASLGVAIQATTAVTDLNTALQYLFLADKFYLDQNGVSNRLGAEPAGTGNPSRSGGSVLFASCVSNDCEVESSDNQLFGAGGTGTEAPGDITPPGLFFVGPYGTNPGYFTPTTAFINPVRALSLNAAVLNASYPRVGSNAPSGGGSISAVQVQINAQYVDISGTITAGPQKKQTLVIAGDVTAQNAGSGTPLELLKDSYGVALATGNIGVQYVKAASGDYLQVNDVSAGAGGEIAITGKILNTNPLGGGELQVLDGYANIDIQNESSLPLHLGTLNAGSNVSGVIKLVDLGANGSVETSIYRDTPGQAVTLQHSITVNHVTTTDPTTTFGLNVGDSLDNPITYAPRGTVYYTYNDNREITRTAEFSGGNLYTWPNGGDQTENYATSPWAWAATATKGSQSAGQPPQSGAFVDLASATAAAKTLSGAIGGTAPAVIQLVSGSVESSFSVDSKVPGGVDSKVLDGYDFYRVIPTAIDVNVETAVKATYPIALVFDPGTSSTTLAGGRLPGGITITSVSPVVLGGPVIFSAGTVEIASTNGISQTPKGLIRSFDVSLSVSGGDIGSSAAPLAVSVNGTAQTGDPASGGHVYIEDEQGSVYLDLASNTTIGGALQPIGIDQISAANTVNITATAGLLGYDRGTAGYAPYVFANIVGHDVTLNTAGSVGGFGASANPLLQPAMAILLSSTPGVPDGAINITATGDVSVEGVNFASLPSANTSGYIQDVRLGSINATGNVLVRSYGSIVSASDATTVDQAQLARFLASADALQLTPADQAAKTSAITAQISNSAYTAYAIATRSLISGAPGVAGATPGATAASEAADAETAEGQIGLLAQLVAEGVTFNSNWTVNLPASASQPTSALYGLALNTLHTLNNTLANPSSETITLPNASDIQRGIQDYVTELRAPITLLLGASATPTAVLALNTLPALVAATPMTGRDSTGAAYGFTPSAAADYAGATQTLTTIFGANYAAAYASLAKGDVSWDIAARTLTSGTPGASGAIAGATAASEVADVQTAESDITALNLLTDQGVTFAANWTVTLPGTASTPSSALYLLAANTLNKVGPLTTADVQLGVQTYVNLTRAPIDLLLGSGAPPTVVLNLSSTTALFAATPTTSLEKTNALGYGFTTAAKADYASAVQTLTTIFGATLPATRDAIATQEIAPTYLASAETGETWNQSELDFAVPSTAFVPVADTQFITRAPVITARGVTLVAANSIGAFGTPQSFTFTAAGLSPSAGETVATAQEIQLAQAYLSSAGPGDFTTAVTYASPTSTVVQSVSFTTRLDEPLQLSASGVVNAVAATNPVTLASAAVGSAAGTISGDIFINDLNQLQIGTIVSQKGRSAIGRTDCNTNAGPGTAACDSEIRLQGDSIIGLASGADALVSNGATLSDPGGRALIMGGLIRLEASQGSIEDADGGPILIDARAMEVVRAARDIDLARRAPETIPLANPTTGGGFSFGADLTVGDVYAGGTFTMDNPFGSLFVEQIPSPIAADNRNSRLVVGILVLRAAGDIGAAGNDASTGLPDQFDITAPLIQDFIAGADYSLVPAGSYDYALAKVGALPAPTGLAPGSGYLAIRGDTVIGGAGSILGARDNLTIGAVPDYSDPNRTVGGSGGTSLTGGDIPTYASSIDIESTLQIGGQLFLTTDGALTFGPNANITGLGSVNANGALDLSHLTLNFTGNFNLTTPRSVILGSISAAGGTIDSTGGSVTMDGTLAGKGGQNSPFTLEGLTGVTTNGVSGSGAIALSSAAGDVTVNGNSSVTALNATGLDVYIHGALTGRSAMLNATGSAGVVKIDGDTTLTRVVGSTTPASLTITAPIVTISNTLNVQDVITLNAGKSSASGFAHTGSVTTGKGAKFLNAKTVSIEGASMTFDPSTVFSNIGTLNVTLDAAKGASGRVAIPTFSGGQINVTAPVEIDTGFLTLTGGANLTTPGNIDLTARVSLGGTLKATSGGAFTVAGGAPISGTGPAVSVQISAAAVSLGVDDTISNAATSIVSTGPVTLQSVLANAAWGQAVSIQAVGLVRTSALTGSRLTLRSTGATIVVAGPAVTPGAFTATAAQSVSTTGLSASSAALTSVSSNVNLDGVTRIAGASTASALSVTAGNAIVLGGPTSAVGGISLTAPAIGSTGLGGYITNLDNPNALITLRANTMSVNFGGFSSAPIDIDARGLGGSISSSDTFNFSSEPLNFLDLWSADTSLIGQASINIASLDMTGWLFASISGRTAELYATGPGRSAERAIKVPVLQQARVTFSAVPGQAPKVIVNGVVK